MRQMRRIALYAGSFDPVTVGHMDIIRRASRLFDEVIAAVAVNIQKKAWLDAEERKRLRSSRWIRSASSSSSGSWLPMTTSVFLSRCFSCSGLPNVRVTGYTGLTADFARSEGAGFLIRGIRGSQDCESERALADLNRIIAPEIETVFLMAEPAYQAVSSTAVREMAAFGAPWQTLVPEGVDQEIFALLARENRSSTEEEEQA